MQHPHADLIERLWRARRQQVEVPARPMTPDQGVEILRDLVQRALAEGDSIVGWKIASIGGEPDPAAQFAAPVFSSSLRWVPEVPGPFTKVEVEMVASIGRAPRPGEAPEPGREDWQMSWLLGLEIIDNHDPHGCLDPGWAIADWGLHGAAVIGDQCPAPTHGGGVMVHVSTTHGRSSRRGSWKLGTAQMIHLLERDCDRVGRPCVAGDFVWTGAVIPALDYPTDGRLTAKVDGFGSVHLPPVGWRC